MGQKDGRLAQEWVACGRSATKSPAGCRRPEPGAGKTGDVAAQRRIGASRRSCSSAVPGRRFAREGPEESGQSADGLLRVSSGVHA